jgi:hypothetical protein
VSDALNQPFTFVDTELSEGIQRHSLVGLLAAAISRKRRSDGEPLTNLLCALLVWPLLKVKSLHCFCAELCQILAGEVSVLYDFLGREDINWRGLSNEAGPQTGKGEFLERLFVWKCLAALRPRLVSVFGFAKLGESGRTSRHLQAPEYCRQAALAPVIGEQKPNRNSL